MGSILIEEDDKFKEIEQPSEVYSEPKDYHPK